MSANNKEPETISLCDMVDDLVHDELELNEDQNNVETFIKKIVTGFILDVFLIL